MKYGAFLDRMNEFITAHALQQHPEISGCVAMCSFALNVAITKNDPVLNTLPPGSPIGTDLDLNAQIAHDALDNFHRYYREKVAGWNLGMLLDEREYMTYCELLHAFRECNHDVQKLHQFVMQRDWIRNTSKSSPLYPLIDMIIREQSDFAQALEQEVSHHGFDLQDPHDEAMTTLFTRFRALLEECMARAVA